GRPTPLPYTALVRSGRRALGSTLRSLHAALRPGGTWPSTAATPAPGNGSGGRKTQRFSAWTRPTALWRPGWTSWRWKGTGCASRGTTYSSTAVNMWRRGPLTPESLSIVTVARRDG